VLSALLSFGIFEITLYLCLLSRNFLVRTVFALGYFAVVEGSWKEESNNVESSLSLYFLLRRKL
jgi:hypothetical protein